MKRRRFALTAAAAAACSALAAPFLLLARRYHRVEVAGPSMQPALEPGDYLLLRRGRPPRGERAFGRIVATRDAEGRLLLKRIVGLPGEALRVGRAVQVNGRVLIEPYARGETPPSQYRGLNRLEDDEYFLLGDRRDASTDSRDFGPVAGEAIEGVAVLRYWPPERLGRLRPPRRELGGRPGPERRTALPEGMVGAPGRPAGPMQPPRDSEGIESGNP